MSEFNLKVGDRVVRQLEIGGTALRHGVITDIYSTTRSSNVGAPSAIPLFAIRWDDNQQVERGYLEVDIRPEPLNMGGLGT